MVWPLLTFVNQDVALEEQLEIPSQGVPPQDLVDLRATVAVKGATSVFVRVEPFVQRLELLSDKESSRKWNVT